MIRGSRGITSGDIVITNTICNAMLKSKATQETNINKFLKTSSFLVSNTILVSHSKQKFYHRKLLQNKHNSMVQRKRNAFCFNWKVLSLRYLHLCTFQVGIYFIKLDLSNSWLIRCVLKRYAYIHSKACTCMRLCIATLYLAHAKFHSQSIDPSRKYVGWLKVS